ncbi:flagellin [Pelagirhabdus alkalitolerans]
MSALFAHRFMQTHLLGAQRSMMRLSSGMRINRASDDAAGLSISEKMRAQIRGLNQASRNAQDGISLIQTAEGAMSESHSILQRMRELSVQASNGTYTDEDRGQIQAEIDQLTNELTRIGEDTEFNKRPLLDGTVTDLKLQIGANQSQQLSVSIGDLTAEGLNIEGLDLTTQEGASDAIERFDSAISIVSRERSTLGAIQNRLEHTISNLDNQGLNLTAAESRIRDVDMAKEMMNFTRLTILAQASQAMLAQSMQQNQSVLRLLQ